MTKTPQQIVNIDRTAATVYPARGGGKLKHFRASLPGLDEETIIAVRLRHGEIAALRRARTENRRRADPLLVAARTRRFRTPSSEAERAAATAAELDNIRLRREADEKALAASAAVRETLSRAAREARKLGFDVCSSKSRDGRVSSYYCRRGFDGRRVRVSDHEIPATIQRDETAEARGHGFYTGYPGPEIVIDRPRRSEWLRRAILLAAAGR